MELIEHEVDHPDAWQQVHEWDLDDGHWLEALVLALLHEDVQGEDDHVPELQEGPQLAPDVLLGDVVVQQGQPGQVQVQVGHFLLGAPQRGSSCPLFSFETDYFCFPFKVCLFFAEINSKKLAGNLRMTSMSPADGQ